MASADRSRFRASNSHRPTAPDSRNHGAGSRPPKLGMTTPTPTSNDAGILVGVGARPPRAAASLATERLTTRSSSPSWSRRTSATSTSTSASTAATSVSSGPSPALSTAEKNRQKQQRYRDRIKETISTLQADNSRLTQENLELHQRVANLEWRNAELEQQGDGSSPVPGWMMDQDVSDGDEGLEADALGWPSSSDDDLDGMVDDPLPSPETTPPAPPEAHPANGTYLSFTPPASVLRCPPAPRLPSLPTLAPDAHVTPPEFPGMVGAHATAQSHYLFRTSEPKAAFSAGPSPVFPLVKDVGSTTLSTTVLGTTPSNVLGLRLDSPVGGELFGGLLNPSTWSLANRTSCVQDDDMQAGDDVGSDKENTVSWSAKGGDCDPWLAFH